MTNDKPTSDVLAPCPFCGGAGVLHENDWCEPPEWIAQCPCGATIAAADFKRDSTIAAWNRRAPRPTQDCARCADLEAAVDIIDLILPLAKGYAHRHRVGNNAQYVRAAAEFVGRARAARTGEG